MGENVLKTLLNAVENRRQAVLATVVEASGSSPVRAGAKILLLASGETAGTVGGGNLEQAVLAECRAALQDGAPRIKHFSLTQSGPDSVDMLCGGSVEVFIEPYSPPSHLLVVGGGHIGSVLRMMGETLGFEVTVIDVEEGRATVPELDHTAVQPNWYVVIITAHHSSDEDALRKVIQTPATYIGMIGSRAKIKAIFQHLRDDGIPEERLARVHAPIGLDLGGPTPEEIALAIMAEIVAVKRGGSGGFRKPIAN